MQWNRRCARFSLSGLESGISGLISLAPNNGIKVKKEPQGVGSLSINEGSERREKGGKGERQKGSIVDEVEVAWGVECMRRGR